MHRDHLTFSVFPGSSFYPEVHLLLRWDHKDTGLFFPFSPLAHRVSWRAVVPSSRMCTCERVRCCSARDPATSAPLSHAPAHLPLAARASSVAACTFRAGAVPFPASVSAPLVFAFSCHSYLFSISSTLSALCLVGVFRNFLGYFWLPFLAYFRISFIDLQTHTFFQKFVHLI